MRTRGKGCMIQEKAGESKHYPLQHRRK
uniref:Uncharacterized protein n=1 Tax=Arundo donax TaxID=35708 RepID=A0A0A9C497_ARUDO